MSKRKFGLNKSKRSEAVAGYLFILPWLLGTIFFFVRSFGLVFYYSFNEVSFPDGGGIAYTPVGLNSFKAVFTQDTTFVRSFFESIGGIFSNTLFILFFAIFVALILKSNFRGRTLVRAIFFLPVIIATGPVLDLINNETIARLMMSGERATTMFQTVSMEGILIQMGLPEALTATFTTVISGIFNLSWKSGVQILLFLAGLQTIPAHLYEAADVEGASAWEKFWRITLPMLTPVLLLNTIYTVIDGFTDYHNTITRLIIRHTQRLNLSYGAALGMSYFTVVFIIVLIIYWSINRYTFYLEK